MGHFTVLYIHLLLSFLGVGATGRLFQCLPEGDQPSSSEGRDLRISRFITLPSTSSFIHQCATPPPDMICSQESLGVHSEQTSALLPYVEEGSPKMRRVTDGT